MPLAYLDGLVADRGQQRRAGPAEAVEDAGGEPAQARAVLADDERIGSSEALPGLLELAGDRPAEDRVALGSGQVAPAQEVAQAVVEGAVFGVEEGGEEALPDVG